MKLPNNHQEAAERIVKQWAQGSANIVLVAPPLTQPDLIFKALKDSFFLKENGIEESNWAIAYLRQSTYLNPENFINAILREWDLPATHDESGDQYAVLSQAIEVLQKQQKKPIIFVSNFHKAIVGLTWEFGAVLRQLENDYGLSTVVQLPVPLSSLRDRSQLSADSTAFICSDFGQGHNLLFLGPYSQEEVSVIVNEAGYSSNFQKAVYDLSGGIPDLVRWAVNELPHCGSVQQLDQEAKKRAKEQCRRFVEWLDAPGQQIYAETIAKLKSGEISEQNINKLKSHDWSKLLVNGSDELKSDMVTYACIEMTSSNDYGSFLSHLNELLKMSDYQKAVQYIETLPPPYNSDAKLDILKGLCMLASQTWLLSPDWEMLVADFTKLLKKCNKLDQGKYGVLSEHLSNWKDFGFQCATWERMEEQSRGNSIRFADFMVGKVPGEFSQIDCLRIIQHRLRVASKMAETDPALACKSTLELPEQILSAYCSIILGLSVWSVGEIDQAVLDQANSMFGESRTLRVPSGQRMELVAMTYIGWILMKDLTGETRLFDDADAAIAFTENYGQLRNPPSHSITKFPPSSWSVHKLLCESLFGRLSRAVYPEGPESNFGILTLDELIDVVSTS